MHRLVCRTKFNIILPDNPCRKVELAEPQYNMENSSRVLLLSSFGSEELLPRMVHGIWKNDIPRTSRTNAKVANNLKELATLSTRGKWSESWVKNPGIEYLLQNGITGCF